MKKTFREKQCQMCALDHYLRAAPPCFRNAVSIRHPGRLHLMKSALAILALPIALGFGGCSESPVAPHTARAGSVMLQQAAPKGTGLAVNIVPSVTLPLGLGGSITIN